MQRILALNTLEHVGQEVTVAGWSNSSRDHGGLIFIDLRDHTGIVQLTIGPDQAAAFATAGIVRDEFVLRAQGVVIRRADGLENPHLATGTIEIQVTDLEILNKSKTLPFPVMHQNEINEDLRLKYRFLDLRR